MALWPAAELFVFPSGGRGRIVARWLRHALDGVWRVVFFGPDTCETRQGTALWVMMVMAWHFDHTDVFCVLAGRWLQPLGLCFFKSYIIDVWNFVQRYRNRQKKEHRELKKRVQLPMLASTAPSYLPACCQFSNPKGHLFHYLPSDSRVNFIDILITPRKNKASNLVPTISISAPPKSSWVSQGSAPYVAKFVRNWANEDLWYICKLDGLWWLYTYS